MREVNTNKGRVISVLLALLAKLTTVDSVHRRSRPRHTSPLYGVNFASLEFNQSINYYCTLSKKGIQNFSLHILDKRMQRMETINFNIAFSIQD